MFPGFAGLHTRRRSRSWGTTRPASIESTASRSYSVGVSGAASPETVTLRSGGGRMRSSPQHEGLRWLGALGLPEPPQGRPHLATSSVGEKGLTM